MLAASQGHVGLGSPTLGGARLPSWGQDAGPAAPGVARVATTSPRALSSPIASRSGAAQALPAVDQSEQPAGGPSLLRAPRASKSRLDCPSPEDWSEAASVRCHFLAGGWASAYSTLGQR